MAQPKYQFADFGEGEISVGPQRTSIMAILSLVAALICIIPGMGILAAILGVASLIGISSSKGRVGGTGLAAAGLVIGLLVTMVWLGIVYGIAQGSRQVMSTMLQPTKSGLVAIQEGKFDEARKLFTIDAASKITDEQFAAFRDSCQAELGNFKSVPTGMAEYIGAFFKHGQIMQNFQGTNDLIPLPVEFDKGGAVMGLQVDQRHVKKQGGITTKQTGQRVELDIPIINLILFTASGKKIELVPEGAAQVETPKQDPSLPAPGTPEVPSQPAGVEPAKPTDTPR